MLEFEWDDAKARANAAKHGVAFERASLAFSDPFAISLVDDRENYGEERFVLIGMPEGRCFSSPLPSVTTVSASSRPGARRDRNEAFTMGKTGKDPEPLPPMADDEVTRAALADPDARPLTAEDFARMRPVPRVKIVRRALGLSLEEFAARYRIPLATLRDWEQGRSEPDQTARAYLDVIASEPDAAARAHARKGAA